MVNQKRNPRGSRSEEVRDIIDRMPNRFGFWGALVVLLVLVLLLVFGWLVRYPDVVAGRITINANDAPVQLVANVSGKLHLTSIKSMQAVKEGQIIGYIQNPAELSSVLMVDSLLKAIDPNSAETDKLAIKLPPKPSLGEMNSRYNAFVSSLNEIDNYYNDKLIDKQIESLRLLLSEQRQGVEISSKRITTAKQNLDYIRKFYKRDSLLFVRKVISESDLDRTKLSYLSANDAYQNSISVLVGNRQQSQQTEGRIIELSVQKTEKLKELRIAFVAAYNELLDNIKNWEQKYIFRSPFSGRVQFLKFWVNNQFVTGGELVFTIVPEMGNAIGQVNVPTMGAGKVKVGQEVIVKLDNFPYNEYGSIKGYVRSIGLAPNLTKTEKGDLESYLITVDFPDRLKTNYGMAVDAKLESKGTAEIITRDRRLIERFFDNLRYIINK